MALTYRDAGRTDEAVRLLEGNLKAYVAKLGESHSDTFATRSNLALVYRDAGRNDEAIQLFQAVLEASETRLGEDHPDTLVYRANLGTCYLSAGRTEEAVRLFRAVQEATEAKLGPYHPQTLASRNFLAAGFESLKRWADAESLRRETLTRRRTADAKSLADKFVSRSHAEANQITPSLLLAEDLAGLSFNIVSQGKPSEAESLLRECLIIRAKLIPDYWQRFNSVSLLGAALLHQGKHSEAEPLLVGGYEELVAREALIPHHARSRIREAGERVIRLYESWGKPDRAAEWKKKTKLFINISN